MLKTRDEQAESAELAEHASSVMTSIDEGIRSLDNMDEFHMYVCQIGQKHCKIPGFQKEYFWVSTSTPSVCSLWHSRADKPQTLPHTARACAHKLAASRFASRECRPFVSANRKMFQVS